MPIKSVEDNFDPTDGMPYLGAWKLGGERENPKDKVTNLDYFRLDLTAKTEHLRATLEAIYGKNPTVLDPVFVIGQNAGEVFRYWRELRGLAGKRVVRRCDEEKIVLWVDDRNAAHYPGRRGEPLLACKGGVGQGGCSECKATGEFYIWSPELLERTKVFGLFRVFTQSINNVVHLANAFRTWERAGNLEGMGFRLERTPDEHTGWRVFEKDGRSGVSEARNTLLHISLSRHEPGKTNIYLTAQTGMSIGGVPLLRAGEARAIDAGTGEIIEDGEVIEEDDEPEQNKKQVPSKPAEPKAWTTDPANRKRVADALAQYGIKGADVLPFMQEIEAGITSLAQTKAETCDQYCLWIKGRVDQRKATTPSAVQIDQAMPPVQPADNDFPLDDNEPESDDEAALGGSPLDDDDESEPDEPHEWTEAAIQQFNASILDALPDKSMWDVLAALDINAWSLSPDAELRQLREVVLEQGWRVTATEVRYQAGATKRDSCFVFPTLIGEVKWFKGTKDFAGMLGAGWSRAQDVEHWRDLTAPRRIEPLILTWELKTRTEEHGGGTYLLLVGAEPKDRIDDALSLQEGELP